MKIKWHSSISSLLFMVLLVSCESHQDVSYKFTSLSISTTSTAGGLPAVTEDSIPAKLFGLRLFLHPQEIGNGSKNFEPGESAVGNADEITQTKIWCNHDVNGTAAGTYISNYFVYVPGSYIGAVPVQENGAFEPTAEYNSDYQAHPFPDYADLIMRVAAPAGDYTFYVRLQLQSGTVFNDSTFVRLY